MREDLRRQYLKALGVPCLVPRFILPGAAVSSRCEMPLAPQPASAARISPQRSHLAPAAVPGALRQALLDSPTERQAPVPESLDAESLNVESLNLESRAPSEAPTGSPRQPAAEKIPERTSVQRRADRAATSHSTEARSAAVRFSLTLCRGGDWLVVDEGPAPTPDYLALLTNLLHACGRSATVQGEDFHWPPPLNRPMQLDLSAAAAGQVLVSRLQTLHQRQPLSRLLLLGQRPQQLLDGWSGEEGVQRLDLPASLWRTMAEPAAKRELWLQLAAAGWL